MKIEIKTMGEGDNTEIAGWNLIPETQEEEDKICVMRDAIFFGIGDRHIEYAGRSGDSNNEAWPINKLMWRRKKYLDVEEANMENWEPANTNNIDE